MDDMGPKDRDQTGEAARLLSYLILGAAGIYLFLEAAALPASRWEPLGAGAFPQLVLGVLVALSLVAAAGSARKLAGTGAFAHLPGAAVDWAVRRRLVLAVFVLFGLYLAVVRWAGFGISTFVFLLATQFLLAPRRPRAWAMAAALSVIFSFGLGWLFAEVFNVFLPRGRW